ncbi:hypothetical protein [Halomonas sp.]|uniref:hypothetical protein n=1 Tax=Halomonas sp. TaxID=1486246 RepID=UPI00384E03A1
MDRAKASPDSRWQLTVVSIGELSLAQLPVLSRGLSRSLHELAKTLCQAPALLVDDLDHVTSHALHELLEGLGLEVRLELHGTPVPPTPLFEVAVHVNDPSRTPAIAEALGEFLGIKVDRAFALLALPPGVVLGQVGEALCERLSNRLGPGVVVSRARREESLFDLHVARGAQLPAPLAAELGLSATARPNGLLSVGLSQAGAKRVWSMIRGRDDLRLVNRDLVRWDVVLSGTDGDNGVRYPADDGLSKVADVSLAHSRVAQVLEACFKIPPHLAHRVLANAPLGLADACPRKEAERMAAQARAVGLNVVLEPAGFERAGLRVESARDGSALCATLTRLGMPVPENLPALIASNLSDLEARTLSEALSGVGAKTRYTPPEITEVRV